MSNTRWIASTLQAAVGRTHAKVNGRLTLDGREYRVGLRAMPGTDGQWETNQWTTVRWVVKGGAERSVKCDEADKVVAEVMRLLTETVPPTDLRAGDLASTVADMKARTDRADELARLKREVEAELHLIEMELRIDRTDLAVFDAVDQGTELSPWA